MFEIALGTHRCPFRPWSPDQGRAFGGLFAYDTETTPVDDERPHLTPSLVLATACDGRQGVILPRELIPAFFEAHAGLGFIAHNAAFDLKVTQAVPGMRRDIYELVDAGRVWDTMILHRLLSLATAGHTARQGCGLDDCTRVHLGIGLPKDLEDEQGRDVRTGFARFLGCPPGEIPEAYLRYAAGDTLATWHLFWRLNSLIRDVLRDAGGVWGYVDDAWLRGAIRGHGPLTHHIQLRASILAEVLTGRGIAVDAGHREEKLARLRVVMDQARERMRRRGYLAGQPGSDKAMQSILRDLARANPALELRRTASGEGFSTAQEDLAGLAAEDGFFADYACFKAAEKLVSTYMSKLGRPRVHPKFAYLLETGRTSCSGFNVQNLPREDGQAIAAATIRGALVPAGDDMVFIDADYGQIELVTFAHACERQFGLSSGLARRINAGDDIHRLIAATVLGRPAEEVTKAERNSAKPVSFGRPGGMGADRLRRIAAANYGVDLSLEDIQERVEAYERLCPELKDYLDDEHDTGLALARALRMTPAGFALETGRSSDPTDPEAGSPRGWLGGMLLKVLRDERPTTRAGRPYEASELDYFWGRARRLPAAGLRLAPELLDRLAGRRADPGLFREVRTWAGRRPVFTLTGRLRAGATFCSARNCIFQGLAADGAIYGLWLVWRAGHRIVSFVHDQVVVESPADDLFAGRISEVEELLRRGMYVVVPGMLVKVETIVTRSLNKSDLDPRYSPGDTARCDRPPGLDSEGGTVPPRRPAVATDPRPGRRGDRLGAGAVASNSWIDPMPRKPKGRRS